MTIMTIQNGSPVMDPMAAALWDVTLPISRVEDVPRAAASYNTRHTNQPSRDLVVLSRVSKIFPARGRTPAVHALKDISISVRAGEIYGVIGRSGAGKSTLIRLINGLESPDSGSVQVARVELGKLSSAELRRQRQSIGMIFQHFNLLASRTVFANIALPLELAGAAYHEIETRVAELLDLVGLSEKRDSYPSELSGGQKQRVAIARALATRPHILLSDEATSSLDPETTRSILSLLARINAELGVTIILITHQMAVIKEICHRVGVIDGGRIVEEARVYDFFSDPQSPTAKALVGHDIAQALPEGLGQDLTPVPRSSGDAVLRLTLAGEAAIRPTLSLLGRDSDIDFAIVQGRVENIGGRPFGTFIIRVPAATVGDHGELAGSPFGQALLRHHIRAEVLGYVA